MLFKKCERPGDLLEAVKVGNPPEVVPLVGYDVVAVFVKCDLGDGRAFDAAILACHNEFSGGLAGEIRCGGPKTEVVTGAFEDLLKKPRFNSNNILAGERTSGIRWVHRFYQDITIPVFGVAEFENGGMVRRLDLPFLGGDFPIFGVTEFERPFPDGVFFLADRGDVSYRIAADQEKDQRQ